MQVAAFNTYNKLGMTDAAVVRRAEKLGKVLGKPFEGCRQIPL
jgi:hypothetical protein